MTRSTVSARRDATQEATEDEIRDADSASRCGRVRCSMSMLTAYAVSEGRARQPCVTGELCRDRRHGGAVGGVVHRARQGADPSALRQLPSGRRPPAPGRRAAGCTSRRSSAARTVMASRPCAVPICHQQANFDPGRVPGHPEWHLAPREMAWEGKTLARDLRADQGSRAQRRPLAGRPHPSHRQRHAGRLGLGARASAASPRPARRSKRARSSRPG